MEFSRFLTERAFATALAKLRAYGSQISDNLLESLELEGLVVPRLRLHFPDAIARRFWHADHPHYTMTVPMEPDGDGLEASAELRNGLYRWRNFIVYGLSANPMEDFAERFAPFVEKPAEMPFRPWQERRVEVSNDHHALLYDYPRDQTFYTTWQLLLASEVADAGIHIRVDLSNSAVVDMVHKALEEERLPTNGYTIQLSPAHATRGFREHANTLDAVIWFGEESDRAFHNLIRGVSGGRFQLSEEQVINRGLSQIAAAKDAVARHQIDADAVIALLKFLSGRWQHWESEGRPFVAGAYKEVMVESVRLAQRAFELDFATISQRVGHPGGWHENILDKVWPSWKGEQQDRVRRTLQSAVGAHGITPEEINQFVEYLSDNNLEAFYWRLKSFEEHAFRGNEYAIEGMQADLQGMAVAVEHVAQALGGTRDQLYDKFKQLWREPAVLALLKRDDVARLSRQARLAQDWPGLKARIEALRQEPGGTIAADLVMAHRIRGGVHTMLPEDDQFQLEALIVSLMRAALTTFAEVKRREAEVTALPAPVPV